MLPVRRAALATFRLSQRWMSQASFRASLTRLHHEAYNSQEWETDIIVSDDELEIMKPYTKKKDLSDAFSLDAFSDDDSHLDMILAKHDSANENKENVNILQNTPSIESLSPMSPQKGERIEPIIFGSSNPTKQDLQEIFMSTLEAEDSASQICPNQQSFEKPVPKLAPLCQSSQIPGLDLNFKKTVQLLEEKLRVMEEDLASRKLAPLSQRLRPSSPQRGGSSPQRLGPLSPLKLGPSSPLKLGPSSPQRLLHASPQRLSPLSPQKLCTDPYKPLLSLQLHTLLPDSSPIATVRRNVRKRRIMTLEVSQNQNGDDTQEDYISLNQSDPPSPAYHRYITSAKRHPVSITEHKPTQLFKESPLKVPPEGNSIDVTGLSKRHMLTFARSYESQFQLSEEQLSVLQLIKDGHNIFYTGSAGTGKSVLLRQAITELRKIHGSPAVAVTALTGLAACNIGGVTLHLFSGIGIGQGDIKLLIKKVKKSKKARDLWLRTKVLIVDEILMVDSELLDKLDAIAKSVRKSQDPFGGIQVVFCGDFYQLPPVRKRSFDLHGREKEDLEEKFAFQATSWKEAVKISVILTKVFRQIKDLEFIEMLNEMRSGTLRQETVERFRALSRPLSSDSDIEPAELFSTRAEVDRANGRRLRALKGPKFTFNAVDSGTMPDGSARLSMLNNFLAPATLELKKGAQVMMIKNLDEGLVNGTLGHVLDFVDPETYFFYRKIEEDDISDEERFESKLEHVAEQPAPPSKASKPKLNLLESMKEEDKYELDGSVFGCFELYEKKHAAELEDPIFKENLERKKVLMEQICAANQKRRYPLVRFILSDGTSRDVLVHPETWTIEDEHENPLLSRTQVPLMLAWAVSIHKSQGQTLLRAKVDLLRVFEKGQAYVAISRVESRTGLQVLNFTADKVMTHSNVREFYETLLSCEEAQAKARELASDPAFIARKFFGSMEPPKKRKVAKQRREGKKRGKTLRDMVTEILEYRYSA